MNQNIYIAGLFDSRARLRTYRDILVQRGFNVRAQWLDIPDDVPSVLQDDTRMAKEARRDLHDIDGCDLILVDTLEMTPRGGREVELGYARGVGLAQWVIGPKRNVFHYIVDRHFDTWHEALNALHQ